MLRLETLTWPELAGLDRAHAVVFVPISPIEEHGPHLPLGTDLLVAQALCERTIAALEARRPELCCILAPAVPIGSGVIPLTGSLGVRQRAVRDVVLAIGRALARDGFQTIVAVSGHMGLTHLVALESVAAKVSRRFRVAMLAPSARVGRDVLRSAGFADLFAALDPLLTDAELSALANFNHGGMLETSMMLHLYPELVRPVYRSLATMRRTAYLSWRGRVSPGFQGYVGDPARARADVGAAVAAALVEAAAQLVERTLEQRAGASVSAPPVAQQEPLQLALPGLRQRRDVPSWLAAGLGALGMAGLATFVARRSRPRVPGAPGR